METGDELTAAGRRVPNWKILVPAALTVVSAVMALVSWDDVVPGKPGWTIIWSLAAAFAGLGTMTGINAVTDANRVVRTLGVVAMVFAGAVLAWELLLMIGILLILVAFSSGGS